MAEQILFNFAEKILIKLGSYALQQIALAWGAKKEMKKLETNMITVKNVILDAEEKQETNRAVGEWLQRLKEIVYDVDDLVDEFATEALIRQVEIHGSKRKQVRYFFSSSNQFKFHYNMGTKIKDVRKRLDEVIAEMEDFDFAVKAAEMQVLNRGRQETYSFVRSSEVVGRDNDKDAIISILMSCNDEENIPVIPIVGMGGLGKTTLAQLVYNDNRVSNEFGKRIWVSVTDGFDIKQIGVKILKALGDDDKCDNLALEQVQNRLQQKLSDEKFFVVFDDVWSEDRVEWTKVKDLLTCGGKGSKIVVTTRSIIVAKMMGTVPCYELKGLLDDECLSVLMKWAFNNGEERLHPNLVSIGREIVKKCGGVPLAARTLGGLLYLKTNEHEWLSVRDNELWEMVQKDTDIMPVLRLSYDQMPSYLKQCFALCSLFHKDQVIEKWTLIYLWMAQGFIRPTDHQEELEDIGERYVNEMVRRSFLQVEGTGHFKMHDLVHDLALFVAGGECLAVDSTTGLVPERAKHVLLDVSSPGTIPEIFFDISKYLIPLHKLEKLRTFVALSRAIYNQNYRGLAPAITAKFRYLRVLQLSGNKVELPSSIGELKHLRCLIVDTACGMTLPESIGKLVNLQYLHLRIRWGFPEVLMIELPKSFGKLVSLRYLSLYSTHLVCLPEDLAGLVMLQRLKILTALQMRSLSEGFQFLDCLRHLEIDACPVLTTLPLGMRCLGALEILIIRDCDALNFSEHDFQGLTRLKLLTLVGLPNLVRLPAGLQESATTLEQIQLVSCSNLNTLSGCLEYIMSLRRLEIYYCPGLLSLPDGLECIEIQSLKIRGCPQLSERCRGGVGEDWEKIEYIPEIETDFQTSVYFSQF